MKSILVLSQDKDTLQSLRAGLPSRYRLDQAFDRPTALERLAKRRYDLVFADTTILSDLTVDHGYRGALQPFWGVYPTLEIIVVASQEMVREAVMFVKAGAASYVTRPINPDEVKHVVEDLYESIIAESELDYLRDQFWHADDMALVQTRSTLMKQVFDKIRSVAPTRSTVLLMGETGTGKSLLARLVHGHSNRRENQFISLHCGAIPDTLLESELFGHEKGAFTGAVRRKLGKFEIAHRGTIFLDEIGTITPSAQIKLLEVLQEGTLQRVGGEDSIEVDVRIISATNADLNELCAQGRFRKDLYYRLNVFPIEIPPLRDRLEDIPHLTNLFLRKMNRFGQKEINHVHPSVIQAFQKYPWPGNIRELENLLERAYILEPSHVLTPEGFPPDLLGPGLSPGLPPGPGTTLAEARRSAVETAEKAYLHEVLARCRGKIRESAESAGITTRQLNKLMQKHGLRKEDFRHPQ